MPDIRKDALNLTYSTNFEITGLQEQAMDLQLTPVQYTATTVYGKIMDGENPIEGATIKVFDGNGKPFQHTVSASDGSYHFEGLPTGSYSIGAVKSGYRMSDTQGAALAADSTVELNFEMLPDESLNLGTIAGLVTAKVEEDGKKGINNAKITIFDSDKKEVLVTYTISDGEFIAYDIPTGNYTLVVTADGYLTSAPMNIAVKQGSIVNVSIVLETDAKTNSGTVNGTIRNAEGKIVPGCFVGLYQIDTDEEGKQIERLLATTKTNAAGQYLFGNVTAGKYMVKAKMNQ